MGPLAPPWAATEAEPSPTFQHRRPGGVLVIGASISNGHLARHRVGWPDRAVAAGSPRRVINASFDGTRLLVSTAKRPSQLRRVRALLGTPGVSEVVLTDLVNDLQARPRQDDPAVIIAGIRRFVVLAHRRGVRVTATTILPYGGYQHNADHKFTAAGERCRQAVNKALRRPGLVDGLIDFDQALADPATPSRLAPVFDAGDHLHISDAGQEVLTDLALAELTSIDPSTRDSGGSR